jgi:hypothetical protein
MVFIFNRSSDLSENTLTSLIFYKTKDNSPSLPPSLKLWWSKKATADEESEKIKIE